MAKVIIDSGARVNSADKHGKTPLHCAAYLGHKGMAKLLIDSGARVNLADAHGRTPLHLAAWEHQYVED